MANKRTVYGEDERVKAWVGVRVGEEDFGAGHAIGLERDGELVAGVVYNFYTGPSVCMHVAAEGKHWLNKDFLYRAFAYPFLQLKCNRVTGLVPADDIVARKFDEHLGFVFEGRLRKARSDGSDMYLYGMLKEECRFLKLGRKNKNDQPA
jgi:RimJ/RimL family protein N-acetyltransferase